MLDHLPHHVQMVFAFSTKRWDGEKHPKADYYVELVRRLKERRPNIVLIINEWRREVVAGLYANAAITLAPSTYEPCGMVTMESQACCTPVITNSVGFMKTSVQDGINGIILKSDPQDCDYPNIMANSVLSLLSDSGLQREMGKAGRDSVIKNHSWVLRAKQHSALYEELVMRGSR